jgi:hypothetical protein
MTSLDEPAIGARRATQDVVLGRLIWLAVALLPVTGLAGIGAFGELKGSAAVYVLAAAILFATFTTPPSEVQIPWPLFAFVACWSGSR